jgi:3-hydroxyisobutyrate dehydrogenase
MRVASMTAQTFIRAHEVYGGDAWSTMVVKLLEDALKTDLRAPGFPDELNS